MLQVNESTLRGGPEVLGVATSLINEARKRVEIGKVMALKQRDIKAVCVLHGGSRRIKVKVITPQHARRVY